MRVALLDGLAYRILTAAPTEMERVTLILATLLLHLVVGEDLYWAPNSNWDNPSNWKYERPPCSGEIADFASIPDNSVIYLNTNVTVRSIILPRNGKLLLKPSITIHFSEDVTCSIDRELLSGEIPEGRNEFVGAKPNYWECSQNWLTGDNLPADHPPCESDGAVFDDEAVYSFVLSNQSISVSSLTVRGVQLSGPGGSNEFQLTLTVRPECATNPALCPCPSQGGCREGPVVAEPQSGGSGGSNVGGIAAGVTIAIIAIIVAVLVAVVVGILIYRKRNRSITYDKDELTESGDDSSAYKSSRSKPAKSSLAFDNPVWKSGTADADDVVNLVGSDILGQQGEEEEEEGEGRGEVTQEEDAKVDLGAYSTF